MPPNERLLSYNVLNKMGNLIIKNLRHLIATNEKFTVKYDYENMIEPSEITSQKTDVPTTTGITSNIVASSVRATSGRIIKNPKGEMEKFGGIWRNVE